MYVGYALHGSTGSVNVFLRSLVDGDLHQLYVTFSGKDWIFFDSAYDIDGNRLDFVEIDREVSTSSGITEDFALNLSEDYLESAAEKGMNVKFVGQRGERTLVLKPHYIEGYLKRLRELTGSK